MNLAPNKLFQLLKEAYEGWSNHKALRLGASVAFYTMFAITPLFMLGLALAGFFFGEEAARNQLFDQLKGLLGNEGSAAIQAIVANAKQPSRGIWSTVAAVITLFAGATGVFVELKDALDTIWQVDQKAAQPLWQLLKDRLLSFAMILVIGFLLLVSLIVSASLAAFSKYMHGFASLGAAIDQALNFGISFCVITILFAMIFKLLPDVHIPWRHTWLGAGLSAFLFELGKFAIGLYLGHSSIASSYGAAGSLVVLLMWVYYSSQTLFFGAELTRVYNVQQAKVRAGKRDVTESPAKRKYPKNAVTRNG